MARVIKADQFGAQPGTRISGLNLDDLVAEAKRIVADARAEADRILADAREQSGATRQEAELRGYAEGLARGRSEGRDEGLAEGERDARAQCERTLGELTRLAESITSELAVARAEFLHAARGDLLDFALEIAEKIVGWVAVSDINAARMSLARAMELATPEGEIVVKVNPEQLEELRMHCGELTGALLGGDIHLMPDEGIAPGGVRLLTRQGEIDATIRRQFDNVVAALLGGPRTPNPPGIYVSETGQMKLEFANRKSAR